MKKRNLKNTLIRYLVYFIVFSFIGSLIEYLFGFVGGSGIAYYRSLYELTNIKIYFIPFYGIVGITLILFGRIFDKRKINFYYQGLLNGLLIISWELIGGLFAITIFGHNLWDYSNQMLNFRGIICIQISLLWILTGYIFSFVYKYIIKRFEK